MTTQNTFPSPISGSNVAFTNLAAGSTTTNFSLTPGFWVMAVEFSDLTGTIPGDQVQLVNVTGFADIAANTAVITATRSGYYNFIVPVGPARTYNITTTNGAANVRLALPVDRIGPS
jgi:hypothetical protein